MAGEVAMVCDERRDIDKHPPDVGCRWSPKCIDCKIRPFCYYDLPQKVRNLIVLNNGPLTEAQLASLGDVQSLAPKHKWQSIPNGFRCAVCKVTATASDLKHGRVPRCSENVIEEGASCNRQSSNQPRSCPSVRNADGYAPTLLSFAPASGPKRVSVAIP